MYVLDRSSNVRYRTEYSSVFLTNFLSLIDVCVVYEACLCDFVQISKKCMFNFKTYPS